MFFDFLELKGNIDDQAKYFETRAKQDRQWAQNGLIRFIGLQKKRVEQGEMSSSTVSNFYKPVKLFADMNDIDLSWKKISRVIPTGKKATDDRPPPVKEIKSILKYGDRRIRSLILTYASPGIRLGSWQYLKWKHVEEKRLEVGGQIDSICQQNEEYYTFTGLEAYNTLKEWMDYRAAAGEKIERIMGHA